LQIAQVAVVLLKTNSMNRCLFIYTLFLALTTNAQNPTQLNQYPTSGSLEVKGNSVYWLTARTFTGQPPLVGAGLYKSENAQLGDSIFEVHKIRVDLGFTFSYTSLTKHLNLSKNEYSSIFTPFPTEPENYKLFTLTDNMSINPLADSVAYNPGVTAPATRIAYPNVNPSQSISESINGSLPVTVVQEDSTIDYIAADNDKLYWQVNNHHIFKRENGVNTEVVNDLLYNFKVEDNALMYKQGSFGPIYFNDGITMYTMPSNNQPTVGYDIIDNQRALFITGTASSNYQHHIYNVETGHHFTINNNDSTGYGYANYRQNIVFFESIDTAGSINPYVILKYMHADSSNLIAASPPLYASVFGYAMNDCSIYFAGWDTAAFNTPMKIFRYDYYGTPQQIASIPNVNGIYDMKLGKNYLYWTQFSWLTDRIDVFSLPITHCLDTWLTETITEDKTIKIYPNPAINNVNIQLPQNTNGYIIITDITGRLLFTTKVNTEPLIVSVNGWAKGMYMVAYQNNDYIATTKLIVE
jgi:Secretion system C-terminal sorting domain